MLSTPNNTLKIKTSAPGKVIIHGEHSVVYGKLAIAASLGLRTSVYLEEGSNKKLEINLTSMKYKHSFDLIEIKSLFKLESIPIIENENQDSILLNPNVLDNHNYLEKIKNGLKIKDDCRDDKLNSLLSLLYLYFGIIYSSKTTIKPLIITVETELSLGSGTGSSASFMVSLAGAFLRYVSLKSKEEVEETFTETQLNLISKWGFCAEKIIHGNPSGIDNTICTYGSLVSFRKGRAPFILQCKKDMKCILVDTKVPKSTAEQVKKVAELKEKYPIIVEGILDTIEHITTEALDYLIQLKDQEQSTIKLEGKKNCYVELGELAELNHGLLRTLGVSHESIESVIQILSKFNIKGKLTGAGGGGYVLAFLSPELAAEDLTEVCKELAFKGYQPMVTNMGSIGVCIEH